MTSVEVRVEKGPPGPPAEPGRRLNAAAVAVLFGVAGAHGLFEVGAP
ncbi:hypothetical protein [Streptosporangium sp. NPDC000396]